MLTYISNEEFIWLLRKNKEWGENKLFSKKKSANLFLKRLSTFEKKISIFQKIKYSVNIFFRNLNIFHFWLRSEQQKRKYDLN